MVNENFGDNSRRPLENSITILCNCNELFGQKLWLLKFKQAKTENNSQCKRSSHLFYLIINWDENEVVVSIKPINKVLIIIKFFSNAKFFGRE